MISIRTDDLTGSQIQALLREHLQSMFLHSPPESVHALDLDGLRKPEITFWTAWDDDQLLGCGALKDLGNQQAELKSMRTVTAHLRRGVAAAMLNHIVNHAVQSGYKTLSLETGSMEAFNPARRLYEQSGFSYCGPFSDYALDPNSVFMTKTLR